MFDLHQPMIGRFARQSPENMARVALVCILTARMPFGGVAEQLRKYDRGERHMLFAWKYRAVAEVNERADDLYRTLEGLQSKPNHQLAHVLSVHGMGMVKGGFWLQLAYGVSGCLDMHNVDRFELRRGHIRAPEPTVSYQARLRRATAYHKLVKRLGGTAQLWDGWCEYLASVQRARWSGPFDVSAEHCRILGLDPGKAGDDEIPF